MVVLQIKGDHSFYMIKQFNILLSLLLLTIVSPAQTIKLETGADLLIKDYSPALKNKRIGIVTNSTGVLSNGTPLYRELVQHGFKVTSIFAPEHGFDINMPAGISLKDTSTFHDSIRVYSLYGKVKKPKKEMLKNIDVLIYDIQDLGVRFYTYISTLFYVLQSAAEHNIPVYVLDRPDPLEGITINGPVLKDEQKSFVGIAPLPIRYGMTSGELALYYAGEKLLGKNIDPDITVVKMRGWNRKYFFDHYSSKWTKTSPNIPDFETALVYPGTCLIEGTNVSEGRGTLHPFLKIGAPFINSSDLIDKLKSLGIKGVKLTSAKFTPVPIQGMSEDPKYKNEECNGISIKVTDGKKFHPIEFAIKLVYCLRELYPEKFKMTDYFDKLTGDISVRKSILSGTLPDQIFSSWQNDLNKFKQIRKKYLLY
jgi:uncharacterized protein YbbC (DUF1343 family)